jgi:Domain of unknown function (DUF2019)
MAILSNSLRSLPVDTLIASYAESACTRGSALENSNSRAANKQLDMMTNIYLEIKSRGIEAQQSFLKLLDHDNPLVRCDAATLALEFAPQFAEPTLKSLIQLHGTVGYEARMALEVWQKGELRFP